MLGRPASIGIFWTTWRTGASATVINERMPFLLASVGQLVWDAKNTEGDLMATT
jgi:hypothetical protein